MSEFRRGQIIATIEKNREEVIRVQWAECEGLPLLDCRVWLRPGEGNRATTRGLTLRRSTWTYLLPEIARALGLEVTKNGKPFQPS